MSNPIDPAEVRRIAHLARLKLSDDECVALGEQLAKILDYVAILDDVNTDGVEPTAHALPVRNVFRDDVPAESLPRQQALANAPAIDGPFFTVPKVLGQDSA